MTFTNIVKIVQRAELHLAGALAGCKHRSYPILAFDPDGIRVLFLYGPAAIVEPGAGLQIYPPEYIASFHAGTGMFTELRAVHAGELGLPVGTGQSLGTYLTAAHRLAPEFLTKQGRLYQDYDLLMDPFATSRSGLAPAERAAAMEFKSLFPQVVESPLVPYYQVLGKDFFAWIGRVAS